MPSKRQVIALAFVVLTISLLIWVALSYWITQQPQVELRVDTTDVIGTVHQLVGVNDYGPDVTGLYGDQVAYDLFQDLGLQRLRIWCNFGSQLAEGLGWGWHHTIFNGTTLADAQSPNFYNWTYLDLLFEVVSETGTQPILTFTGCPRSIAQDGEPNKPPNNLTVYAEVVARVVMHYTGSWPESPGPAQPIDYVEIGNEPNLTPFWNGTKQEFFNLYEEVSQRLALIGGSFKIGGPGLADHMLSEWTNDFLDTITRAELPLDFFSWHAYWDNPIQVVQTIQTVKGLLVAKGYTSIECLFNEWGQSLLSDDGWDTMQAALHASFVLTGAAYTGIDIACFSLTKDAPIGPYNPDINLLWGNEANIALLTRNPTTPKPTYHALKPFAAITNNPILAATLIPPTDTANQPFPLTYLATQNPGQHNYTILIANHGTTSIHARVALNGAPTGLYHAQTSELSNTSITQEGGWTNHSPLMQPIYDPTTDITIHLPPQTIIWLTTWHTNPTNHQLTQPNIPTPTCLYQNRTTNTPQLPHHNNRETISPKPT